MSKSLTNPQFTASAFIVCAIGFGLVPLFWFVMGFDGLQSLRFDQGIFSVLLFTLKQALFSTLISIGLGMFAARALVRREFLGKRLLLSLFAVPFATPAIVAVLGVSALYGAQGWIGGWFNIYGLAGILLVHVFFNLPLATKIFYEALSGVAPESFRLAAQLSFSNFEVFWHLEWPALRGVLHGTASLIFLLCAASFVVVLTLGGPTATTLEVAIYQALRMDFDVGRALALSLLQIVLCLVLVTFAARSVLQHGQAAQIKYTVLRYDGRSFLACITDGMAIIIAMAIVLPPLLMIVIAGLPHVAMSGTTLAAAGFSLVVGSLAAMLALLLAWPLAQMRHVAAQGLALAGLIVPPAVLATGWFLALKGFDTGLLVTLLVIITLNGLMALPFAVAVLRARFSLLGVSHDRLCQQLGLQGWDRFRQIDLPFMQPALRQAGLLAFVMSLGDLTAVTLLGSQGLITLPGLIHQQMGNYRSNAAAGTALILALACYGLAVVAQRGEKIR